MATVELDPAARRQLNELLDQALDQAPTAREQWVATLEPRFETLKPYLRDLLSRAAGIETGDWLHTLPKLDLAASSFDLQILGYAAGEHVGPYQLLREIGRGGMSSVWLAQREEGIFNRP